MCKVCASPYRTQVDLLVASGQGWTATARALPESAALSPINVREHTLRQHSGVTAAVAERLIADAHGAADEVLALGVERAIRRLAEAAETIRAIHERIAVGEITPTLGQGLKAARLLIEQEQAVRDAHERARLASEIEQDLVETLRVVKAEVDPSDWSSILSRMADHERLRLHLPAAQSG